MKLLFTLIVIWLKQLRKPRPHPWLRDEEHGPWPPKS